jgi:hypothetical protein
VREKTGRFAAQGKGNSIRKSISIPAGAILYLFVQERYFPGEPAERRIKHPGRIHRGYAAGDCSGKGKL